MRRIVTVSGSGVTNPCNLEVKIGCSYRQLLEKAGWDDARTVKVIAGGPMMGIAMSDIDVPVVKGTSAILCFTDEEMKNEVATACIRCGKCVDVCPMELSPLYFVKYAKDENWQGMKDMNVMDCVECRCCQYICSSKIPIIDSIKAGKNAVRGMK